MVSPEEWQRYSKIPVNTEPQPKASKVTGNLLSLGVLTFIKAFGCKEVPVFEICEKFGPNAEYILDELIRAGEIYKTRAGFIAIL